MRFKAFKRIKCYQFQFEICKEDVFMFSLNDFLESMVNEKYEVREKAAKMVI